MRWTTPALGLVLLATSSGAPAGPDVEGLAVAINTAGRQRMLSQRVVKAYCLEGIGAESADVRAQRFEAIERFEAQLAALKSFARERPVVEVVLARVDAAWADFEPIASGPVRRDRAMPLLEADAALLAAAEEVVAVLERMSGRPQGRMVNLAGRQRMLSQRLTKTYVFLAWGLTAPEVHRQFVETWSQLEAALSELQRYPQNTPRLVRSLERAAEEWRWMQSAIGLQRERTYFPDIVDHAAEQMLSIMEEVTGMYERLLDSADG